MRGRHPMASVTIAARSALSAGPAQAHSLRGAGGALGGFNLIAIPVVQKELKLDDDQVKKAKAVSARMSQRFQLGRWGKLKGLRPRTG